MPIIMKIMSMIIDDIHSFVNNFFMKLNSHLTSDLIIGTILLFSKPNNLIDMTTNIGY